MSSLHRRALAGGKTVSRKARAKPESGLSSSNPSPNVSPGNSRAGSRANSLPGSRYASEDEYMSDHETDDVMRVDTNSIDGDEGAFGGETSNWAERLRDRVTELQDRKRSNLQGRVKSLTAYNFLLEHNFAQRQLDQSVAELLPLFLKLIQGGSEEERSQALQAFTLTILTCGSDTVFEEALPILEEACYDAETQENKAEALRALCIAVIQGGGSQDAAKDLLEYLLAIIESDGESVNALDSGPVVTAALQGWAFVASHLSDLTFQQGAAIEAFEEQLNSSDAGVQTGAGVNIALLFEWAREYEEETGESPDMQYNQHRTTTRMEEIVRDSSKSVSKKDRRNVRSKLSSVLTSLERGKGPGYSTAGRQGPNPHTGGARTEDEGDFHEFGYRERIRIYNQFLLINTWSLEARVEMLKALLKGGFGIHYLENPLVREILSGAEVEFVSERRPKK
ncbi:interferon-related developmental regulator-domain-containing protein [Chaetomium sp. MPI-SDFR-AT-0129]|nr:interferon-related developmental regulator-domain-containing protein [Chaetomium sp. MPI-SDFR-AT-0129]